MKKVIVSVTALLLSGCFIGAEHPRHHSHHGSTIVYEPPVVEVETVYIVEPDPDYYEFYNYYGEWCYGDRDPHYVSSCFEEWCYDHIDDWWYEWDFYCTPY